MWLTLGLTASLCYAVGRILIPIFVEVKKQVERMVVQNLNVRQDDLSGLDLGNQGTGTRSFSSSNQFRTMWISVATASTGNR